MLPLLRIVDEYCGAPKGRLAMELVYLSSDKFAVEERMKWVANAVKLQARLGYSVDGVEGPGNYGLNKECMMTIVVVTAMP